MKRTKKIDIEVKFDEKKMNHHVLSLTNLTAHYMKLVAKFRTGKYTIEDCENILEKDMEAYVQLRKDNAITDAEYRSILILIEETEDHLETLVDKGK
jgi:hypothetical protein